MTLIARIGIACLAMLVASAGQLRAGVINSASDPALLGATVDNFSSYAIDNDASEVSNGFFTLTDNVGGTFDLSVTDIYDGSFGAVGRSVVSFGLLGITIDFAGAVSAAGIHIGGSDADWTVDAEAFNDNGISLGSATVNYDTSGFFLGWADSNIGSIVLSPVSSDAVLFDNLHYVEQVGAPAVPEPTSLAIFGIGALCVSGVGMRRRRRK